MPDRHRRPVAPMVGLALAVAVIACSPAPTPTPTAKASPGPSATIASVACPVTEQTGPLFTNTLVDVRVDSDPVADRVTFVLGEPVDMLGNPTGVLKAAEPPFIEDGSGFEVDVLGEHHVALVMNGMQMFDAAGEPTFNGEGTIKPSMLSLKQVELTGAFEGIFSFVIGYDGVGCVALSSDEAARTITVAIGH